MFYHLVAIVAFIIVLILANHWLHLPFIGVLTDPTLVLNQIKPSQEGAWPNNEEYLNLATRYSQVNGENISSTQQLENLIQQQKTGDTVTLNLTHTRRRTAIPGKSFYNLSQTQTV